MLENSIQNSTGIALAELMESPVETLAYSKETQRVKIKDKMYVVVDGICNPEVDDVLGETSKRKIVSFSCGQDGKNVAALSFLQNRGYFFTLSSTHAIGTMKLPARELKRDYI